MASRAEDRIGDVDLFGVPQVGAPTYEARVRRCFDDDVGVGRCTAGAGGRHPIAGDAQGGTLVHPTRDLHLDVVMSGDLASAPTVRAGVVDDRSSPRAGRARCDVLDEHVALAAARGLLTAATAGLATAWLRASTRTAATARLAAARPGDCHRLLAAGKDGDQRDGEHDLDVASALRPAPPAGVEQPLEEPPRASKPNDPNRSPKSTPANRSSGENPATPAKPRAS